MNMNKIHHQSEQSLTNIMDFEHFGVRLGGVKNIELDDISTTSQQNPALDTQEHLFSCSDLLIMWLEKGCWSFSWWLNEKHQGNLTLTIIFLKKNTFPKWWLN